MTKIRKIGATFWLILTVTSYLTAMFTGSETAFAIMAVSIFGGLIIFGLDFIWNII